MPVPPPAAPTGRAPLGDPAPPVSVVMVVLNEQRHVADAVRHALDQDYAGPLEVVVALGPSRDRTDEIVAGLARADPRVRSVRNPSPTGATPAGLNAAIAVTDRPVLVRADGHALLPRSYVRTAVETLARTGADNVGGVMAAAGTTPFERAVARAMTSPFGVGNARFHTGGAEGPADTVYLGVFRRAALERVGGYADDFVRAQDWELNHRIRETGGTVWFQPALEVTYRPRRSYAALARQYFEYGRWRRAVARRHPGTLTPRYLAPPLALGAVASGLVLGAAGARRALVVPVAYAAGVLAVSVKESRGLEPRAAALLPGVLATMHMSWGLGFVTSPRRLARGGRPRERERAADRP